MVELVQNRLQWRDFEMNSRVP